MLDQKFWAKYFKVYDILNIVIPYQELLSELERELDLNNDDVVLDVGSGTGNLMFRIKGRCKKIIGTPKIKPLELFPGRSFVLKYFKV